MWFVWILFAIPLFLVNVVLLFIANRILLKMQKDNDEYEKQKEGRYDEQKCD